MFFSKIALKKQQELLEADTKVAELNLKQIIDRLNAEFTGETRKLVFWYDDKAELSSMHSSHAHHVLRLPDNTFSSASLNSVSFRS